jgi:carbon-monoxide dehydrogenase small subunit
MEATITLTVNGKKRTVTTDTQRPLLDVLREDLDITGCKYGCGEGLCGACSVLMEGQRIMSCVTPAVQADNKTITTVEGLVQGDALHPVQEAFLAEGAMQCGYCTPGMILTAVGLLEKNPDPTDEEIVAAMNANICRCNGYVKIMSAVRHAAEKMRR